MLFFLVFGSKPKISVLYHIKFHLDFAVAPYYPLLNATLRVDTIYFEGTIARGTGLRISLGHPNSISQLKIHNFATRDFFR